MDDGKEYCVIEGATLDISLFREEEASERSLLECVSRSEGGLKVVWKCSLERFGLQS